MPGDRIESGPSDLAPWRRAAGDHAAFGHLFDRHAHAIYNFCLRRTGDRTAAEDLVRGRVQRGRVDQDDRADRIRHNRLMALPPLEPR